MTDFDDMMKAFNHLTQNLSSNYKDLANERIDAESGGGMVRIKLDGVGKALSLEIDPLLLKEENKTHVEQLILAAFNQGKEKWDQKVQDHTKSTVLGNLPSVFKGEQD